MGIAKRDVPKLAASYRRLVLWFGVQLVIAILGEIASAIVSETTLLGVVIVLARSIGLLVTIVALVIYAYRTAAVLGSPVPFLWSAAMLIPLINAITLLVLSAKSTNACRAAGIPVGLFGPKVDAKVAPSRQKRKKSSVRKKSGGMG